MMAVFLAEKHFSSLRPVDDSGIDILKRIPMGRVVSIEVRMPRNEKFHRLYWALISKVWENVDQERYPTAEDLHTAIKIAAGLRTQIILPDGTIGFIAGSTAFHKMDGTTFSAFFDRVCDLIAKHFLPGVSEAELKEEVSQMIGIHPDTIAAESTARATETEPTVEETAAQNSNLSDPDAGTDGSDGRAERESRPTPASLSVDDRETLQLFVEDLKSERSPEGVRAAKRRTFGDKVPQPGSALATAANAIYEAHQRRVKAEISVDECDRLCREARR